MLMSNPAYQTDFSAKEPSLGYYYQIRYSLYLLLREKVKDNPSIRLEDLDDIVLNDIDGTNLYQTKLHINSVANLSERSSDFWKTIRVWSEAILNNLVDVDNTIFTLITTAKATPDSFISKLTINSVQTRIGILESMQNICKEQNNQTNQKGYSAFLNLSSEQQIKLINNIYIIDASLSIEETLKAIKEELKYSAPVGKINSYIEKIEGWWFQQCILLLTRKKDCISSKELQMKISDTRDLFMLDNLPDDFPDPLAIDESEIVNYEEKIFIKQLKLIAIKSNSLRNAISDFRRAFEQRSKWLRDNLIGIDEYDRFDKQLYDYWNNIFALMKDDCDGLTEQELEKAGKAFYEEYYIKKTPAYKIRNNFQPQYLTRGSCHMLADEKRIGWHPNFQEKLQEQ